MKEAWVALEEWSKKMVTAALEAGADALVVPAGWQERVKALGRFVTVSADGDLKPGEDVFFETLGSPEDEARIGRLLGKGAAVIVTEDQPSTGEGSSKLQGAAPSSQKESAAGRDLSPQSWASVLRGKIIPLENLTARGGRLLIAVRSMEDVELALGILEKGVSGVVIQARNLQQMTALIKRVKAVSERETLREASILAIRPVGVGDRVCVDTCTLMREGEGLLVGNSSGFLFLVQAEAKENPYVAPRPFRVNAGPVHAYLRAPGGRTRYLSELEGGDPVLIVDAKGDTQQAAVGRVKIERRPLLLIEAECEGVKGSILLQNAETIRLTGPDGEARSVVDLQRGDIVLVAIEAAGRHFGMKVEETIREK